MVQSKFVIALIPALSLLFAARATAEPAWTKVSGQGYAIMAETDAGTAVRIAARVERMRTLLGAAANVLPLRVILVTSDGLFQSLRPSAASQGFYQSSADEDWIVVRWGAADSERAVSHELVHAFLEHSGPRRPLWLEEGLAEFYSTAEFGANAWTLGRPVAEHVHALNRNEWMDAEEFFAAAHDSPLREEGSRAGLFYAQSWAVAHTLLASPQWREKTPGLMATLGDGQAFDAVCRQRLGVDPRGLLQAARRHIRGRQFAQATLAPSAAPLTAGPPNVLARQEVDDLFFALALSLRKPRIAAKWARTSSQKGLLALATGDRAAARRWLEQAVDSPEAGAAAHFELAMLLREDNGDARRVDALLRETLRRNPNHAEAHFILGLRAAAQSDSEQAIEGFQSAARILPRQASFWHALALELERAGRKAEAAHAALRCRMAARNAAEREMAAGLQRLVEQPPAAKPERNPAVRVPESWRGLQGDRSVEGELIHFACDAKPPLVRIRSGGAKLELRVTRPNEIRLTGAAGIRHAFACGEQRIQVRVEFREATRELTAVEFR